jgi:hypothetical protein
MRRFRIRLRLESYGFISDFCSHVSHSSFIGPHIGAHKVSKHETLFCCVFVLHIVFHGLKSAT